MDNKLYNVVLLDPPWSYYGSTNGWGDAAKFYVTMTDDDVYSLHVPYAKPSVVFLWTTGPKLAIAVHALEYWNLFYRGVAFVWVKTTQDGVPIKAQGVRPSIVKPLTEFVLVGSTQSEGRPLPLASEAVCQTIFAPKREHSRKPDEVRERIDQLYPNASKLEMFSRGPAREGWDLHGDQTEMFA